MSERVRMGAPDECEELSMPMYMLLQNYEGGAGCDVPMTQWTPEEITAHIAFQRALNKELLERGELVDAHGLAGSDRVVVSDGVSAPVVTDGPFAEVKELLAGYRLVDVESEERALEIAAMVSAAPGVGAVAIQQPIHVRQVMSAAGEL